MKKKIRKNMDAHISSIDIIDKEFRNKLHIHDITNNTCNNNKSLHCN